MLDNRYYISGFLVSAPRCVATSGVAVMAPRSCRGINNRSEGAQSVRFFAAFRRRLACGEFVTKRGLKVDRVWTEATKNIEVRPDIITL